MNDAVSMVDLETAPVKLGRQLAAARESSGLGVADVARQIKLSPAQVEAIEAGKLERLPGGVFARGFIRNYARLVKLDPEVLLAGSAWQPPPAPAQGPDLPPSVDIPFPTGRELKWRRLAIAGAVAVAFIGALAIFEWRSEDAKEMIVKPRTLELPQPQARPTKEEPVSRTAGTLASVAVEPALVPVLVPDTRPVFDRSATEKLKPPAPVPERRGSEHQLKFTFDRQSWIEVRDRSGRRLISRLNAAGSEQTVSGEPPLGLVIGNAGGVRLTHNGTRVDLAPYTNVDVARLTLE